MIPPSQLQKLEPCPNGPLQIEPLPALAGDDGVALQTLTLSLAIPTYNEGQNIGPLVERLIALLDSAIPQDYELIVVDDDSPDLTWNKALELQATYPQVRVLRRQTERGLSSAVIRGWQSARGRILGVIDADLQHPPEVLLGLLKAIQQGADLAVGSRHVEGGGVSEWSLARRVLSRGAQTVGLLLLPRVVGRVSDPMSGYFMVQREAIAGPLLNPKGYKILLEVLGRGTIDTIAEVGYVFQERQEGASKVTWRQYIDYIHHLLRLRLGGRLSQLHQRFPMQRFVRFGVVGLSGVVVDMVILYLLHSTLGIPLTRSKIGAAEVAIINNFIWNDAWTFADISMLQQGWSARLKRFLKFNLVCLAGLVLNVLVLNVIYNLVFDQRWPYLANLVAIAIVTFWNFWLNLKLSWRVTQTK
ncbi:MULTISPECIES: glycosyltransferase [Cyanophyceae]|uniref:glycosyltransferase n=1 Tax=Cyanophyceae TaxID=3028117 RepID=UPI001687148B|nr:MULTISPECIES: glycosyltransferase [Cyanophyceae]MBD1917900.1 glycosyltransferase [Phormidium sp. FACHB-77]MBD2029739.1 glycosyltransferase [Phormidium sp. FACHB-322]MBD2052557.1 glycosyltransferase [Leptolyngbya sp. FACHB-60]